MLHISICDDNLHELQSTITLLENYSATKPAFSYQLHSYSSAEALLEDYSQGTTYDLILLDIYMEGQSGISAAQTLRSQDYEGQLVFLTTSTLHALSAFEVNATQYLVKPLSQHQFSQAMDKCLALLQVPAPSMLLVRHNGDSLRVPVDSIAYSETEGHYQQLHLSNGQIYSMRNTATNLFASLEDENCFMQVGKIYIINYHFIKSINATAITMMNGDELHLPRRSYHKIVEQYFSFYQNDQ